jgi:glycosyltransferase involved in cell wall biosynthesis
MKFITFIIPTIGRETLNRTLQSIKNQTINDWDAVVVFDGVSPNYFEDDERIKYIKIDKLGNIKRHAKYGFISNAGLVRNEAFKFVDSEWIGFVDDDDIIYNDYIERIKEEVVVEKNNIDLILFRMNADRIIPKFETNEIKKNEVGISFIIKNEKLKLNNLKFKNCDNEDYVFFCDAIKKGLIYKISKHVTYQVCGIHNCYKK